ncbi:MAG TPA: 50S ribosomal protein L5, partial [Armatimonadota bacterium]|nr:50S ribosomal protein L5 [Armatimonadota bacterium]
REQFAYGNVMQIPRVVKVIINMGVGEALQDSKTLDNAVREMALISGQKPLVTRAKKSIAAFKLREGNPIGCKVTLRGARMWEFMDRLFSIALPRIRDFQGLPAKSFDGRGNYTLGIKDQTIFPEISIDSIDRVRGMDITIVTTAETDEEARTLLTLLGLPLRKS